MRRVTLMLAAAVLAGLVPAVAVAGGGRPGPAPNPVPLGLAGALPDATGPVRVDPAVVDAAAGAAPGGTLDLVLSLEAPADGATRSALDRLGVWSRAFDHVPAAAVRLPVARLDALRDLDGLLGVYLDEPIEWFLKESVDLVDARRAWEDLGVTGEGVTVAVLDTGVDFTHPDLAPAMRANVKLAGFGDPTPTVPLEGIPNSDTSSGHGTHVAGDVAGRGTASDGAYRGLAPGADLVGLGVGDGASIFAVLEGFDWILANQDRYDIRVVNNSWGTGFEPFDPYDPVTLATKRVAEAGIVVVFANGNDGAEMTMNPYAAAPWVLAVAAGSKDGKVADFSSHGIEGDTVGFGFADVDVAGETRRPLRMGLYHPAVTTPGEGIVATRAATTVLPLLALPEDTGGDIPPEQMPYYTTMSGTSMASPEAAGIVALVLEAAPELSPDQVRMVLQSTARPIPDVPFHVQGYGYTDAAAAVELARSLHGRSPAGIRAELERIQAARDEVVLSTLAEPIHTYAWQEQTPTGVGSISRKIEVQEGAERVKVLASGGGIPLVGGTSYDVTVIDAAGREVGRSDSESGTSAFEVDLREIEDPAFGEWTVEILVTGSLAPPMSLPLADDFLPGREISTIVSVFGPEGGCGAAAELVPTGTRTWRFQDDTAAGAPFPANPEYTYVGAVEGGTLGAREPERRLAGTFGQLTTNTLGPVFTTAPLEEPLTVSEPATIETWIQGPSEAVQGLLVGQLLDVPPEGEPTVIGETPPDVGAEAGSTAPLETEAPLNVGAPYTVPAGHRLGVSLLMSFVGTSAHTLFYDSAEYPSGVTVTTGRLVERSDCPSAPSDVSLVDGATDPQPAPPDSKPAATAPSVSAVPSVPSAPPALLPETPAAPTVPPAPPALPSAPPVPAEPPSAPAEPPTPPAAPPPLVDLRLFGGPRSG